MGAYEHMRNMSDEELIERYDKAAKSTITGLAWIRDELHRREMRRNSDAIHRQSRTMTRLTWIIAILTAVNVLALLLGALS